MTSTSTTTAIRAAAMTTLAAGRARVHRRPAAMYTFNVNGGHSSLRRLRRSGRCATSDALGDDERRHVKRWVTAAGSGSGDAVEWRVRQVYGDGKVLLDQLREVADMLADGFNASGRTSKDLLNGLVQKVRWSGGNFVCLVADDGGDGSEMVGACDLTLLPAGGPKKSREGLVADVPSDLALEEDTHFLYLTGMVVPTAYRRRGIGQALLAKSEVLAAKMAPTPVCIALHVDKDNAPAQGLYKAGGYKVVGDDEEKDDGGEKQSKGGGWSLSSFGIGKRALKRQVLMVKWLPVV